MYVVICKIWQSVHGTHVYEHGLPIHPQIHAMLSGKAIQWLANILLLV